jgi:hypothetical protein
VSRYSASLVQDGKGTYSTKRRKRGLNRISSFSRPDRVVFRLVSIANYADSFRQS